MTKKELAKKIADEVDLDSATTLKIVQRTLDGIIETLEEEGRIELRNFGVFQVKKRKAREARNPKTGERVSVPESVAVKFKPGKEMEERVGSVSTVKEESEDAGAERLCAL